MDVLPTGPAWKTVTLDVEGYTTIQPLQLIWCDAEEVVRSLFGNLIFGANMAFDLVLIKNALSQEYSEWFLASEAYRIQVRPLLALYESEWFQFIRTAFQIVQQLCLFSQHLTTCHKFFFDHVLLWCKKLLGAELDVHFKCHHKRTGVRHFAGGISHVKQMTDSDHHDIQHTIVTMIAGHVPGRFLCAIRALSDFIYQVQSPVYTDSSIEEMEASLREFHAHKNVIIKVGARKKG